MPSYFIYARKSSESEDRQALSIDAQTEELKQYAQKQGLAIAEVFTESQSAKRSGRPVFSAMLKALENPDVTGILCWKLDRLSRNLADAAILSEAMDDGILQEIRTPSQTYGNTSTDRFMSGMEWLVGRKYIDDLSENVKRGMNAKVAQGWYPGMAPLGYLNDRNHPQGHRKIVNDSERFELVRKLWEMLLSGRYSVPMIHEVATEKMGLTTLKSRNNGGNPITRSGLYQLFANVFYTGHFRFGGEIHKGNHEPMVSMGEYDRVQELLGRHGRPRPKRHQFAFTGLIHCGQCGAAVTAEEKFKLIKSTGKRRRYVYYHCTHKLGTPCQQKPISEAELRRQIDAYLSRLTIPRAYLEFVDKYLHEYREAEERTQQKQHRSLHSELKTVEQQLENLIALRIAPGNENGELLSDSEYSKLKNRLTALRSKLQENLTNGQDMRERVDRVTKEMFDFAYHARAWFESGTEEEQRTILANVGSDHTLMDRELLIIAQKPLRVIEERPFGDDEDSGRLEPSFDPQKTTPNGVCSEGVQMWYALVNEVRTEVGNSIA